MFQHRNGLKFVFGGDTYPNKWFVKYTKDADLVILECFITVQQLVDRYKWPPKPATKVQPPDPKPTYLVTVHKWLFPPNSSLLSKFNPRNISYIPVFKFIERLDLEENVGSVIEMFLMVKQEIYQQLQTILVLENNNTWRGK